MIEEKEEREKKWLEECPEIAVHKRWEETDKIVKRGKPHVYSCKICEKNFQASLQAMMLHSKQHEDNDAIEKLLKKLLQAERYTE